MRYGWRRSHPGRSWFVGPNDWPRKRFERQKDNLYVGRAVVVGHLDVVIVRHREGFGNLASKHEHGPACSGRFGGEQCAAENHGYVPCMEERTSDRARERAHTPPLIFFAVLKLVKY